MSAYLVGRGRLVTLVAGLTVVFGGVLGRLYYWQMVAGPEMAAKAQDNREGFHLEKARRGDITDRQGTLLATTRALITLGCDPTAIPFDVLARPPVVKRGEKPAADQRPVQDQLASLMGMGTRELLALLQPSTGTRPVRWRVLKNDLSEAEFVKINSFKIKGIYGNRRYERVYPQKSLACHILGFVSKDVVTREFIDEKLKREEKLKLEGKMRPAEGSQMWWQPGKSLILGEDIPSSGVESYLDYFLKGTDGWVESNHDALRREIYQYREREVEARSGLNVELTLDSVVQSYAEEEVAAIVAKYTPKGVSILVSDPSNGEILALANYPNFNPNEFGKASFDQQRNRAVADFYEPGSTFKIVAVSAALETGVANVNSVWDCAQPSVIINGKAVDLPDDHEPLGRLTTDQVIAKSSNRGTALIGVQLGGRRLYDYAKAFGFGENTGFGFGGETPGMMSRVENWDGKTITRFPIGHSVSVTPIQVHSAMGVIASGGLLMRPHVVRRIADADNNTIVENTKEPRRRVISAGTAATMTQMLTKVLQPGGTAVKGYLPGYEPAGKTGTTQKIIDGHYSKTHHVASFSGFFPASSPRLLITITVDEPHGPGVGYGGLVAAPIFKSLSEKLIPYLKIPPVPGSDLPGINIAHDR